MKFLTTLTGPSCAGKSTLEAMMANKGCLKAISTTTRPPRAGEVDGVDYYFVSNDKFNTLRKLDMMIEAVKFGSTGMASAPQNWSACISKATMWSWYVSRSARSRFASFARRFGATLCCARFSCPIKTQSLVTDFAALQR